MLKNLALLGGVMALIGGYTWYVDYQDTHPAAPDMPPPAPHIRIAAPEFPFTTPENQRHSLNDFKGAPIILNFWASWCAPCVVEFPQMVKLAALKPQVTFIFISIDDSYEPVVRFLKKYGQNLPKNVLIGGDPQKHISGELYQTFKVPETYLIDGGLMIREKIIGADADWTSPEMQQKIDGLQQ